MKINQVLSVLALGFAVASPSFAACNKSDIQIKSLPFKADVNNRIYCLPNSLVYDAATMKSGSSIQFIVPSYAAITVTAPNVVINLNGQTLSATNLLTNEGAIAIYSSSNTSEKISVRNGVLDGFDVSVVAHAKQQSIINKVTIKNGKFYGIAASAPAVDISENFIYSLKSRWPTYMSAIDVEKSSTANIYNNTIKTVRAKNANPVPDVLESFYGAHGISAFEFQSLNIFNNNLSDLATTGGEFSYISLLNFNPSTGKASVYNNSFTYPTNHSASKRKNLGFFMIANNVVELYDNEYIGFVRNVVYPSNIEPSNMTYFNNIFHRYQINGQYDSIFPQGSATPLDAGGNEFIYH